MADKKKKESSAPRAGEIDPIKAFVVIVSVVSVIVFGLTYFWLEGMLDDTRKANRAAEKSIKTMIDMEASADVYLNEFKSASESAGGSGEGTFANLRARAGIAREQVTTRPDRPKGTSRQFDEIYTQITIKSATWDQINTFMHLIEKHSPKYKILDVSRLARVSAKTDDDNWKVTIQAAYRTQRTKR